MQDLLAAFMPKFAAIAKTRLARSLELAKHANPDATAIGRELHSIAGEAGLLGLTDVVSLTRAAEEHAKRLRATPSDAHADALRASLTVLQGVVEQIAARV